MIRPRRPKRPGPDDRRRHHVDDTATLPHWSLAEKAKARRRSSKSWRDLRSNSHSSASSIAMTAVMGPQSDEEIIATLSPSPDSTRNRRGAFRILQSGALLTSEGTLVDGADADAWARRASAATGRSAAGGSQVTDPRAGQKRLSTLLLFFIGVVVILTVREYTGKAKNNIGSASAVLTAGNPYVTQWQRDLSSCTGPDDGYVYGAEAGGSSRILTYVRKSRQENIYGPAAAGDTSSDDRGDDRGNPVLADVIRWAWTIKRDRGVLAYKIAELATRRAVGVESAWECVFASNFEFNFYKASPSEFVLSYTPSYRYQREARAAAAAFATDTTGKVREDFTDQRPALRGGAGDLVLREMQKGVTAPSVACGDASTESPPQDAVLVNIRPVGPVSLLLTPGYPNSHNQRADAYALAVAMDFAEALRSDPGFRLGFNSGGSSASVNHLHFQCWHFDASETGGLAIERSPTRRVATVALGAWRQRSAGRASDSLSAANVIYSATTNDLLEVYTLEGYPLRGLVFHTLGKDLETISKVVERCVNYLVETDTPHTMLFSTGRAFLLPRQHLEEPPFAVVPGFPEVSGEIIVTAEKDFESITADQVFDWWRRKISVSQEHFQRIVQNCLG